MFVSNKEIVVNKYIFFLRKWLCHFYLKCIYARFVNWCDTLNICWVPIFSSWKILIKASVVLHAYNPNTLEIEAGGLEIQNHPWVWGPIWNRGVGEL